MNLFPLSFFIIFCFLTSKYTCQQLYSGNFVLYCNNTDKTGPSPDFLYSCNGEKPSCQAFLIYRSQSPYNSITAISKLTSSNPSELARINNISSSVVLPEDKEVIVPVTCSCSGNYYQANTSYVIQSVGETYFTIANNTYQGLSTCDSLLQENPYGEFDLDTGLNLRVPLRCACPTSNQTKDGIKFLLTYLVTWDDSVPDISSRFNASSSSTAYANGFSEEDPTLFPFTTILIPLQTAPLSSQTEIHHYQPVINFSPTHTQSTRKSKRRFYIGIGIGASLAVLCFVLFLFLRSQTDESSQKNRGGEKKWILPKDFMVSIAKVDEVLPVYAFEELKTATENFSSKNRSSASVYRGVLGGKTIAVKKMSTDVLKEVKILKKINHFNLISLYGVCEHDGMSYLVYEFMENGSLKAWLNQKSGNKINSWNHRIRIALDIANGLDYLHNFTDPAYVHQDISSSNVLLNRDLRAKITNFGLARSAERGESENPNTWCVIRTRGYLPPEYLEFGKVTTKMDVYAFGVILLELITGREANFEQDGKRVLLSEAVLSIMDGEKAATEIENLIDPHLQIQTLGYTNDQNELALSLVKLSVACLEQEPIKRLSMAQVASTLMRIQLGALRSESSSMK